VASSIYEVNFSNKVEVHRFSAHLLHQHLYKHDSVCCQKYIKKFLKLFRWQKNSLSGIKLNVFSIVGSRNIVLAEINFEVFQNIAAGSQIKLLYIQNNHKFFLVNDEFFLVG